MPRRGFPSSRYRPVGGNERPMLRRGPCSEQEACPRVVLSRAPFRGFKRLGSCARQGHDDRSRLRIVMERQEHLYREQPAEVFPTLHRNRRDQVRAFQQYLDFFRLTATRDQSCGTVKFTLAFAEFLTIGGILLSGHSKSTQAVNRMLPDLKRNIRHRLTLFDCCPITAAVAPFPQLALARTGAFFLRQRLDGPFAASISYGTFASLTPLAMCHTIIHP